MQKPVLELRVALTVDDYERLVAFYRDGLGLDPAALWTTETSKAVLFELGRGTLEIFDDAHAAQVDEIEVGRRVSGPVRFALQVPDLNAALERLRAWGATVVHEPVVTPWRDYNARVQSPDGLQVTLFQPLDAREAEG
ncbi:MAG: VOC family protein [Chloroflexota bacterium]|nr:MAG: glyoxalase [Chloroflexota bacterium]